MPKGPRLALTHQRQMAIRRRNVCMVAGMVTLLVIATSLPLVSVAAVHCLRCPSQPQLHPCIHHAVGPQVCIVTDVTSPSDADDGPHVRSMQARARWVELAAERYRPKRPLQQRYRMPGRALSVICCWLTATPCACTHPHAANPLSATNLCQIQRGMLSMQLPVRLHVSLCLKLRCLHLGVTALVKHASTPTDNTHAAMPAAGH